MTQILTTHDFSEESLLDICTRADTVCQRPSCMRLNGKVMATLFFEPSTRTRLSFEAAMVRMGGSVISVADKMSCSDRKGESFEDTVRTVAQYADVIVSRTGFPLGDAEDDWFVSRIEDLPCHFINAGDGSNSHPTQGLLDYYTIRQHKMVMDGHKICIVGDLANSRTINSLVEIMGRYPNNTIYTYNNTGDRTVKLPSSRHPISPVHHLTCLQPYANLLSEFDVLYLNRIQSERHKKSRGKLEPSDPNYSNIVAFREEEEKAFFKLTREHLDAMKENALVMNPGPRLGEMPSELDDDPRVVFFEQVKNGMLTRMGLLDYLFGG